jgi:F-type H+-transporting ATPase subunit alpha
MEEQVVSIFSATPQEGRPSWVRPLELEDVSRYEKEMLDFMRTRHGGVLEAISTSGKLEDETRKKLADALDEFAKVFVPTRRPGSQAA